MTTIQIRIDDKTKKSAKKVLDKIGIDMSSAMKVYLRQIVIYQGIPLKLVTENGLSPADEKAILKASKEAKQGKNISKPFKTSKETQAFLDSLK